MGRYFRGHADRLRLELTRPRGAGLRECQLGAYWAIWSHFTTTDGPALASLPTGAGKTVLMEILAFGLRARRVLVVTPATILRDQTADEFASMTTLARIGAVPARMPRPRVHAQETRLSTAAAWRGLNRYDVVVATPHTVSPEFAGVAVPPTDLFDLVLIDEAHHSRAPTWARLLTEFHGAKCVLLTATPFRRDKRRLQAPLVYFYSIGRALDVGIYRPVRYMAVQPSPSEDVDSAICRTTRTLLAAERRRGNRSMVLVRADRVAKAHALVRLYRAAGIPVEAVDYQRSLPENAAVIEAVRRDQLDGIVCVGMVGEGLDLPELKIAAFHDAPESLPFTLQFIGRVSRPARGQVGDAYLVAVPDEVRGPMRRLYHQDADWRRLIPQLVQDAVGPATTVRHVKTVLPGSVDVDPTDLRPFFSIRVYDVDTARVDLSAAADTELPENVQVCVGPDVDRPGRQLVLMTETQEPPGWAANTALANIRFDLHFYYHDDGANLLFEYSTAASIARRIRSAVASAPLTPLRPDRLIKVLGTVEEPNYMMVGLRNATGGGPSQPSYKTLLGTSLQAAVVPSDGRVFAPGHALVRFGEDEPEVRGVGLDHGRVWAVRRDSLAELQGWCRDLARLIARRRSVLGLPQLEFLARPRKIDALDSQPLAVLLDPRLQQAIVTVRVAEANSDAWITGDAEPAIDILQFERAAARLHCAFEFAETADPLRVDFRLSGAPYWTRQDPRECTVRVDPGDGGVAYQGDLDGFLAEYPPVLVAAEGGVIVDDTLWAPDQRPGPLPAASLVQQPWTGCDRSVEFGRATRGRTTVHQWVEQKILRTASAGSILIYDHRKDEIADYVLIEPPTKMISLFHCKRMRPGGVPADRVGEFYEVIGQACRSTQWVRSPLLLDVLSRHAEPPRLSPVVRGRREDLRALTAGFQGNAWAFRVVICQPGCSVELLRRRTGKVYALACAGYEWITSSQALFEIWGG